MRAVRALLALALLTLVAAPSAVAAQDRFSLAGGCFDVPGVGSALRLQATDVGSYLLITPQRTYVTADGDAVAPQPAPSPAADWVVSGTAGALTMAPRSAPDRSRAVSFAPSTGTCVAIEDASSSTTGRPKPAAVPFGEVRGWLDGHTHWMQFGFLGGRFKCGRPWHPYGVRFALPDCSDVFGPQRSTAFFQNTLVYGSPVSPGPTDGWPTLSSWDRTSVGISHEGLYWRWVERAWLSGERIMVMPVNENRVLCELQTNRTESCDEMETVRRAVRDIRKLQDYADAQAGGPGKGFFEVVTDPFQARRVMNEGRLAVVLEIEVSELFGCRGYEEKSSCTRQQVEAGVDEMHRLGVRSMLLLNKFDSPLAGVRFDSGEIGLALINNGNYSSSGSFWSARTCEPGDPTDNTIATGNAASAQLNATLAGFGLGSGALPTYPPAPHCNTRGLTQLGAFVVRRMMDKGMIINPDHMSQRAVEETITLAESRDYAGVISPHGWMDVKNFPRIWALGGVAMVGGGAVEGHIKSWETLRPRSTPYPIGWGLGTDIGGLFAQPEPSRRAAEVTYPFRSDDGAVTFDRLKAGERTFDYAKEGIATYGLYADWVEDLRRQAPPAVLKDFFGSADAYLGMWERASGVPRPTCLPTRTSMTSRGLGALRLGRRFDAVLRTAGQPISRSRAWTSCVRGTGDRAGVTAVFSPGGSLRLVGSTATGHRAGGVTPGTPVRRLRGRARQVRPGVWVRGRFAYRVAGTTVRTVAVATPSLLRRPATLARELRAVVRRVPAPPALVLNPKASTRGAAPQIPALQGRRDVPAEQLALLCSLLG